MCVAAGAMRQNQTVSVGSCRDVQEPSDWRINGRVSELADGGVRQGNILIGVWAARLALCNCFLCLAKF